MKQKNRTLPKALAAVTAMSLTAGLAGCAGSNSDTQTDSSAETQALSATYTVNTDTSGLDDSSHISDTLFGLFLEDINYAVDAGLYAELVKNRSFEYGTEAANGAYHGWINSNADTLEFTVTDGSADHTGLNDNNPSYATLTNSSTDFAGIGNVGYLDGLAVMEGEAYTCSLFIKGNNYEGDVRIAIEDSDGKVYAEDTLSGVTGEWQKLSATLTPSEAANEKLRLWVQITQGSVDVDMVSLMPEDTYAGLPIRKDLGEYLEALNPSFLRFPGGCVIEGRDEESIYNWKDSVGCGIDFSINGESAVGDVATRPQGKDIWKGSSNNPYYTTYGLGFYEYFMLCEALDALPVPVLNAGMTCQVQSPNYIVYSPTSEEFQQYIQDALDLVEFCRGDASTKWGAVRIAMGHEAPFPLKYIAIGNEQWQSEYHAHYMKFAEAFEQAAKENPSLYGDIELILANGTASGSREGWNYLEDFEDDVTTLIDEHYYEAPDWFLKNTTRYDSYDRDFQAKVFLGEYAAQSNTLMAALAEAAYMTGLERNGDVVEMACYAPLLGNGTANQWTPDMIFFNNDSVYGSVNYYVQQMFATNAGTTYLDATLDFDESANAEVLSGQVGLGSWMTSVAYDNLKVTDNESGKTLYETDFSSDSTLKDDSWTYHEGDWSIEDGRLMQTNTADPADTNTGDAVYVGDKSWTNYTLTVDAEILGGNEGFLIPICVENTSNEIFWNLGGWGNTVSCLQIVENNAKSGQVTGTVKQTTLKKNEVYQLKVEVTDNNIKCYVNDMLYVDYTVEAAPTLFASSVQDENGDLIIKLVNNNPSAVTVSMLLDNFDSDAYDNTASITTLSGEDLSMVNDFSNPTAVAPVETSMDISSKFKYEAPKYSVTVIRIGRR